MPADATSGRHVAERGRRRDGGAILRRLWRLGRRTSAAEPTNAAPGPDPNGHSRTPHVVVRELPAGKTRVVPATSCRQAAAILARDERWMPKTWSVRLYPPRGGRRTFEVSQVEWAPRRDHEEAPTLSIGYIVWDPADGTG